MKFFQKSCEKIWRLKKSPYLCGPKTEGRPAPEVERKKVH